MVKIQNVLVATDFGEASDSALNYGREIARMFGATLHLMHVVDNPLLWAGLEGQAVDLGMLQAEMHDAARDRLRSLLSEEDRRDLHATTVVRTSTAPAFEIAAYAAEAKTDLIVIGTHGRGAMGHLMMGSVAEKVVRVAPCPVLTVHAHEREFVLPDALQRVAVAKL